MRGFEQRISGVSNGVGESAMRGYTIFQAEDNLWCIKRPDGTVIDGESYVTKAAAQASVDRWTTGKVRH